MLTDPPRQTNNRLFYLEAILLLAAAPILLFPAVARGATAVVLAWAAVWIPIGWGVWMTLTKAVVLFR